VTTVINPPAPGTIRIVPLGGLEEVGKNMSFIEFGNDIIVMDIGFQFTDEETPGVDYILPNTKYLEKHKDKIRALLITHGHLDHIGGMPYLIDRLGYPPIYTRQFGALFIKKRQEEFPHLKPLDIHVAEGDEPLRISPDMRVRFFGLTHSIPDSTGIIVETPYGDIINTGDVRVDNIEGIPTDKEVDQFKIFKKRNVLMLMMDSTNIEHPGWSLSESIVVKNVDQIVKNVGGRIIIATFASQVERIIEFLKIAKKHNKKVVIEGRSMKNNVAIVKHLNLVDTDCIIPIEDIPNYPPDKIVVIATGAQGEEFAALMRIANKTHKQIKLNNTDTVILSSSIIPGNEKSVAKLKDNLYHHDAHIITYLDSSVHASGHGKRAELSWVHKQIPYKYFMPIHGHHYMLKMHAEVAQELGTPKENIIVGENGSIIEISNEGKTIKKLAEKVPADDVIVEGQKVGDIQEVVIKDRQMLAADGMFVIIATLNLKTGRLKKSPDIISRGFVYLRESQELLQHARLIIKRSVESTTKGMRPINFDYVKDTVAAEVSKFLFQKTLKKPIVIPVILGV
jgi:ribonuclease J